MSDEKDNTIPPWHPLAVPGQAWTRYWQLQRGGQSKRSREKIEAQTSPDPRHVEPKKHPD